jgi:hypothetical protein
MLHFLNEKMPTCHLTKDGSAAANVIPSLSLEEASASRTRQALGMPIITVKREERSSVVSNQKCTNSKINAPKKKASFRIGVVLKLVTSDTRVRL